MGIPSIRGKSVKMQSKEPGSSSAIRQMRFNNAAVIVSLDKPVALDIGSHFAIREGGKTVGSGVITEVVE